MGSACKQAHESYYTANVFRDTKQGVCVCVFAVSTVREMTHTGLDRQGWYFLVSSPMARAFKYRPSLKSSNFRRSPKTASRERSENDADEIASNEQTDA